MRVLKIAWSVSQSFMVSTILFQKKPVEHARRSSIQPACTNGLRLATNPLVHSVVRPFSEKFFPLEVIPEVIKQSVALDPPWSIDVRRPVSVPFKWDLLWKIILVDVMILNQVYLPLDCFVNVWKPFLLHKNITYLRENIYINSLIFLYI